MIEPVPPSTDEIYSRDLSLGMHGDDVRVIQAMLGVVVDGSWGPVTEAAAQAYRKARQLPDGAPLRLEMVVG